MRSQPGPTNSDAIIVEDDYDAEFRYDREPIGAVQGLAPDRVVSHRHGQQVAGSDHAARLDPVPCLAGRCDRGARRSAPTAARQGLDQLVIAKLIESGRFDRHLRRMRTLYAAKRDALVESLAQHAPSVELTGLSAGFHAVAHLPEGVRETDVVDAARGRGVGLYGMSANRANKAVEPPQLVLGFGNLTDRAIRSGIGIVGGLLEGTA